MNKKVSVEGLTMAATSADGLEISLGSSESSAFSVSTTKYQVTAPAMSDVSWKSSVTIADYYSDIGKLSPASSDTGLSIYYVGTSYVKNAGQDVASTATVSLADYNAEGASTSTTYNAVTTVDTEYSNDTTTVGNTGNSGYYVDIPMWIRRTAGTESAQDIYCAVKITDGIDETAGELKKAVRVAIIPVDNSTNKKTNGTAEAITLGKTYEMDSTAKGSLTSPAIFGLTSTTWKNGSSTTTDVVLNGTGTYSEKLGVSKTITTASSSSTDANATTVFTMPKASEGCISEVAFVARVWLEGESDSCWDATAEQDWQIDLYFATSETDCKGMIVTANQPRRPK